MGDGTGGGTEVFATVAHLTSIPGPSSSTDTLDSTSHSSPDGYRQFLASLMDGGEISVDGYLDPAHATHNGTTGLLGVHQSRARRNFKINLPTDPAATWAFAGIVTGFDQTGGDFDGMLEFSATIKISGKPTLT